MRWASPPESVVEDQGAGRSQGPRRPAFRVLLGFAEYFPEFSARRRSAQPAGRKSSSPCIAQQVSRRCSGGRGTSQVTYTSGRKFTDAAQAVALAGLAAATLDVKAEAAGAVAALARFGEHGEQFADRREDSGIGRGIRARRAADRRLIDLDHFVDLLGAFNRPERARTLHRAIQLLRERAIENVVHQSGFSRS